MAGTKHGLKRQFLCSVLGKTDSDRSFDQALNKEEKVGRTATAHRCGHVKVSLISDIDFLAHDAQDGSGLLFLCFSYLLSGGPDTDSLADLGWRIGHRPNHLAMVNTFT